MDIVLGALVLSFGINLLMFIPAFIYKTDRLTDISYSITFAVVAMFGYIQSAQTALHKIITILVLLWAFRLGSFLFIRIQKRGRDVRFDGMREDFGRFLRFWLLQALTVFVVMLGPLLAYTRTTGLSLNAMVWIGAAIFLSGLLIESVADAQKARFTADAQNKGKWIDIGIWRASRHPNYLGEMMVWIGMYIVVASALTFAASLGALLSPLFIIILLRFVSGVPLLEKSAEKKWGGQAQFKKYLSEVPLLVPTYRSLKRLSSQKQP